PPELPACAGTHGSIAVWGDHPSAAMMSLPNSSSSLGMTLVSLSGLDTQVSLIRSRQVMLLLVALPPQLPQPSEKVWRIPFHRLPELEDDCGWLTMTRLVLVPSASFMMFSSLCE